MLAKRISTRAKGISKRSAATIQATDDGKFGREENETPSRTSKLQKVSRAAPMPIHVATPGVSMDDSSKGELQMKKSLDYLMDVSPEIKDIVKTIGYPTYPKLKNGDFMSMARSLISQQISVAGAITITAKVEDWLLRDILPPPKEVKTKSKAGTPEGITLEGTNTRPKLKTRIITPFEEDLNGEYGVFSQNSSTVGVRSDVDLARKVLNTSDEEFTRISIGNGPKKRALLDLASHIIEGTLDISSLKMLRNEQVIAQIKQVSGFGLWSAQMYLIFTLGREDVWPASDLALQQGLVLIFQSEMNTFNSLKSVSARTKWATNMSCRFPAEHHSALARLCYSAFNARQTERKK